MQVKQASAAAQRMAISRKFCSGLNGPVIGPRWMIVMLAPIFSSLPHWGGEVGRGGERSKRGAYRFQNALEIVENLIVPKPDDPIVAKCEFGATLLVKFHPFGMLAAVELDR
jgi:hypothetical protein